MTLDELVQQLAVLMALLVYLIPLLLRRTRRQQADERLAAPDVETDESERARQREGHRRRYDAFEDPLTPRRPTKEPAPAVRQPRPSLSEPSHEHRTGPALRQARPLRELEARSAPPRALRDLQERAPDESGRGQLIVGEDALQRLTRLGATEELERRMHTGEQHAAAAEREMRKRVPRATATPAATPTPQPARAALSRELLVEAVVLNAALSRRHCSKPTR